MWCRFHSFGESQTFLWKQKAKKAVWWWCTMAFLPEKSTFIWLCTQHMLFFLILSTVILPGFVVLLEKGLKIPNTFVQMALAQEAWLYLRSHEKKLLDPKKRDAVPSFWVEITDCCLQLLCNSTHIAGWNENALVINLYTKHYNKRRTLHYSVSDNKIILQIEFF